MRGMIQRFCRKASSSTMPPDEGYVLGTNLNCSESLGCHRQWLVIHPLEITHIQGLPSFAVGENAADGCDQPIKFDRFGVELITSRRERLFAFTGERSGGEGNTGNVAILRMPFGPPRGLPTIHDRHFEVHQDDVWPRGSGPSQPFPPSSAVSTSNSPRSSSRILSINALSSLS